MRIRLYQDGEKVLDTLKNKNGFVVQCINLDDPMDIREQGFRYYVDHSGWRWSIRESHLVKPKILP